METKSLIEITFLLQLIINGVSIVIAQKPTPTQQSFKCGNNGNFKTDAAPKQRDAAFEFLYKMIAQLYRGYAIGSRDTGTDGVWTMALCPPIIKLEACRECLNNTIPYLNKNCPKQREGVAWTALPKVTCIVRYKDSPFATDAGEWAWTSFSTPPNQTPASAVDLEKGLNTLADKLKGPTVAGHTQNFASGAIAYGPGPKGSWPLYGYMQCSPSMSKVECMKCLTDATNAIHNCCSKGRKLSGIALATNCYFWYAHMNFTPKALPLTVSSTSLQTSG